MRFVTPLDRVIQAGGEGVTKVFWLLAVAGAISFPVAEIPESISLALASTGATIYWMRFRDITVVGLIERIVFTRARYGDTDD